MNARQITTLMHKLFYGDISQADGWVHLFENGELNQARVDSLISRYIEGDELLLFVNAQHCAHTNRFSAFPYVRDFLNYGVVRIADLKFRARILIHPIGVGVGSTL